MLRRCTATLALTTAAALILAAEPSPASAAGIVTEKMVNGVDQIVPRGTSGATNYAYYSLTNPTGPTVNDLIVTTVIPPNSVSNNMAPLTVVDNSSGFDPKNFQVLTSPNDPATQGIAFLFGNGGLATGAVVNFKFSLDPGYTSLNAPELTLTPPDTNLSATGDILSYTPIIANGSPGEQPAAILTTPEPVSLALWSALAAAGLLRARAFRKSRQSASA